MRESFRQTIVICPTNHGQITLVKIPSNPQIRFENITQIDPFSGQNNTFKWGQNNVGNNTVVAAMMFRTSNSGSDARHSECFTGVFGEGRGTFLT